MKTQRKLTPYGYIRVAGALVSRYDTLTAAEGAAKRIRVSLRAANLITPVFVESYTPRQ